MLIQTEREVEAEGLKINATHNQVIMVLERRRNLCKMRRRKKIVEMLEELFYSSGAVGVSFGARRA